MYAQKKQAVQQVTE